MEVDVEKLLEITVPGLVTGLGVAVLSVRLALKRFYSEKWWERKYDAYSKIFDALFHMRNYAEGHYDAELERRDVPEERDKQLSSLSREARDELNKAATVWAFILSRESTDCLKKLRRQLETASNAQSFFEYLELELTALGTCIETLRECAEHDLKVSHAHPWGQRFAFRRPGLFRHPQIKRTKHPEISKV